MSHPESLDFHALPPRTEPVNLEAYQDNPIVAGVLNNLEIIEGWQLSTYPGNEYQFSLMRSAARSEEERRGVQRLADTGEEELALRLLDASTQHWEPQTGAHHYESLATTAAGNGKVDLALAITLDNNRILFWPPKKPEEHHFGGMYWGDGGQDDIERVAEFSSNWLLSATRVYAAVATHDTEPNATLLESFWEKVDLYSSVVANRLPESISQLPAGERLGWSVARASENLAAVEQIERAAYLGRLVEPAID